MKLWIQSGSANEAWLKSLPVALFLPVTPRLFHGEFSPTEYTLPLIIHLIAYAGFGIPVFLRYYPFPEAPIWKFRYASLCGGFLGALGVWLVALPVWFLFVYPRRGFDIPYMRIFLVGAGYGVCSGAAAWLARPGRRRESSGPPPLPRPL